MRRRPCETKKRYTVLRVSVGSVRRPGLVSMVTKKRPPARRRRAAQRLPPITAHRFGADVNAESPQFALDCGPLPAPVLASGAHDQAEQHRSPGPDVSPHLRPPSLPPSRPGEGGRRCPTGSRQSGRVLSCGATASGELKDLVHRGAAPESACLRALRARSKSREAPSDTSPTPRSTARGHCSQTRPGGHS